MHRIAGQEQDITEKRPHTVLKGFRDFILKGNVVELATAVIIGAAFTAIVTAFTDGIVQPIINSIPVGSDAAQGLGFQITDNPSTFVDLGSVITAVINFLIIAAVVYFIIILPYNKLAELGGFGKKAEVTEIALLSEIRDLLDPDGASKAKAWRDIWGAGQGVGLMDDVPTTAEMVERLKREYEAARARLSLR